MRIILAAVVSASVALALAGCSDSGDSGKTDVVASFYPLAEAARQVGGNEVHVTDLTPPGAEPHDLEITTKQLDAIEGADVDLVMGRHFQPAVEEAVSRHGGEAVVRVLDAIGVSKDTKDPHVWLDPVEMHKLVDSVRLALIGVQPKGAFAAFNRRAATYLDQIDALDAAYRTGLASCRSRVIVTSHEAFGWLAKRYGLDQHAIAGVSPDREPDPRHLSDLAKLVETQHVTTIFTEQLVSPKISQTLAREVHVKTAVLDPIESITKSKAARGADYISIMRDNLKVLRTALGCS